MIRATDEALDLGQERHTDRHELPSIKTLVRDLRDESLTLIRQEIALAKTEMSEKVQRTTRSAISIGAGAGLAYAGLIVLLIGASTGLGAALVEWGLSEQVAVWLAPLIIGLLVVLIGYALIKGGQKVIQREGVVPEKTVDSMKETKAWAQEKVQR